MLRRWQETMAPEAMETKAKKRKKRRQARGNEEQTRMDGHAWEAAEYASEEKLQLAREAAERWDCRNEARR